MDEQGLVMQSETDIRKHQDSWLMFTPTDLLKHFVKEAFNRERIPGNATNEKIKTWEFYRNDLARRVLGILQITGSKGSKFIFKDKVSFLNEEIWLSPVLWYESFRFC